MISVIIPMYDTGNLICRCLDAILDQDYEGEYEVIVVDDGSTDNSASFVRLYADRGVRLVCKPNGGPASARNRGLDECSVESRWVTFIDSDDYVEPNFLSALASLGGDMKICALLPDYGEWSGREWTDGEVRRYEEPAKSAEFASLLKTGTICPFWNKLYSLDIIRRERLRIAEMRMLEDSDFNFRYLTLCNDVEWCNRRVYNYIRRDGSETSKADAAMVEGYADLHSRMLQWFDGSLAREVDEFVYPQYFALLRRLIMSGDHAIPRRLIGHPMVRQAFRSHRCCAMGERIAHGLMRCGWFGIAARLLF